MGPQLFHVDFFLCAIKYLVTIVVSTINDIMHITKILLSIKDVLSEKYQISITIRFLDCFK